MDKNDIVTLHRGTLIHVNGMPFLLSEDTDVIGNENNLHYSMKKLVKPVEKCQYCGQDRLPPNSHDMFCNNSHGER